MDDLKRLQREYREKLKKGIWITAGAGAIWVLIFIVFRISGFGIFFAFFPIFFTAVSGMVVTLIATTKSRNAYHAAYKEYFVARTLREIFPGCNYNHAAGIPREKLAKLGMMTLGDSYSSNDFVSGEYKGLKFAQADVGITEEREDSDGNSYTVTLFMGRYAIFEFKKKFDFRLEVVGKRFGAYIIPRGSGFKKFSNIKTESSDFNKLFRIIAEDGFEAFYILDPAFIERVQKLGEMHDFSVALFFAENRLHIAINNSKDSFEAPSAFKEIDENSELEKVREDIKLITDVVDSLAL